MNKEHLNDFIERARYLSIPVGNLVSEYTSLAISYSADGFKPTSKDYDLAYQTIQESDKYKMTKD